jgi:WD40 repeat protein/DNA-binding SARP family transcriptional activator
VADNPPVRSRATVAVQFRILGPLAASRDGETVPLGGERQRGLLALLLVNANEIVSTEQLIEQLFGGTRSRSAANAVHVAVSRLRRALGDVGGAILVTRGGGYLLALEPEQLDATMFERALEAGHELLARGDAVAASVRFSEALSLWQGAPLADLPAVDAVQAEIRRLDELRLRAQMERIDAELALGHADGVVAELERLVAREPLRERLRGQLMLALYRSGRQAEALATYREASVLLRDELGLTPGPGLRELERMILRQDDELDGAVAEHQPAAVSVLCPFKGLAVFESSDAEFFCGRDRIVSELIARLAEWPLVGILGPSGIGKSSLLRAGVLPALQAGALPGSVRWRQALLRPGEHPAAELEAALGGGLERLGSADRVLLAVDQLEELFTVCDSERERHEFLAQLVRAADDAKRRVLVLCTLRADFYGRLSIYPEFAELISRCHALVGPMDRDELAEAIQRPVARAGLEIEPRLVEMLVTEVGEEPGGLPLLSTTLLELWQAREGRSLRLEHYRATGGVHGAVARIAEAAYTRLSEREQRVARNLLLRLVDIGDGSPERRRVRLAEVEQIDGAERVLQTLTDARLLTVGAGAVELSHEAVVREWPRYRHWLEEDRVGRRLHEHLRVASAEWKARGRDPGELYRGARLAAAVDFSAQHADQMDRLEREFVRASWVATDREARRQHSQNRRLRLLLAGAGALLILTVVAGVMAFLGQRQASVDARLAVAEGHAALGRQLAAEAQNESRLDAAALLAREAVALDRSPLTEGALLSVLLRNPAVIGTVRLPSDSAPQVAISPDGRTLAVSDSAAGQVQRFDADTHAPRGPALTDFHGDQPPAYSEDGSLLVYTAGSSLVVRNSLTLSLQTRLPISQPFSQQMTADLPDGSIFVTAGDHTVLYAYWVVDPAGQPTGAYLARWSLPSAQPLATVRLGAGPLLAVRLIDHGAELVVVTARQIATYDTRTARLVRSVRLQPVPELPTAAVIGPDGGRVVIGSETGSVSFVDVATGAVSPGRGRHATAVSSAVYAPDGTAVTTVDDDGTAILWNPATGTETATLSGPAGRVRDAAISPTGATLYTAEVGGVLLAWDLTGRRTFGETERVGLARACCEPIDPPASPLAVSPNGSRFAALIGASTVGVFSTETLLRQASFTIKPAGDAITALAWSPAGALGVGAQDGVVQLWNVEGRPRLIRSLVAWFPQHSETEAVQDLAFSPDGSLLVAADKTLSPAFGRTMVLPFATMATWRVATGRLLRPPVDLGEGASTGTDSVAFSRAGGLLAVTLLEGGVRIFDPSTGRALRTLADPSDNAISLAFSPSGILAAGTQAGTVEMWNPATGRRVAQPMLADAAPITAVEFDPAGQQFATTGYQDGSVKLWSNPSLQQEGPRLLADAGSTPAVAFAPNGGELLAVDDRGGAFTWPTAIAAWERRACSLAGSDPSRGRAAQLVGGRRYAAVCP